MLKVNACRVYGNGNVGMFSVSIFLRQHFHWIRRPILHLHHLPRFCRCVGGCTEAVTFIALCRSLSAYRLQVETGHQSSMQKERNILGERTDHVQSATWMRSQFLPNAAGVQRSITDTSVKSLSLEAKACQSWECGLYACSTSNYREKDDWEED